MTTDEALGTVCEAADKWAAELVDYIIPAIPEDEQEEYAERVDEITTAIKLVGEQRDALARIREILYPAGDLDHEWTVDMLEWIGAIVAEGMGE